MRGVLRRWRSPLGPASRSSNTARQRGLRKGPSQWSRLLPPLLGDPVDAWFRSGCRRWPCCVVRPRVPAAAATWPVSLGSAWSIRVTRMASRDGLVELVLVERGVGQGPRRVPVVPWVIQEEGDVATPQLRMSRARRPRCHRRPDRPQPRPSAVHHRRRGPPSAGDPRVGGLRPPGRLHRRRRRAARRPARSRHRGALPAARGSTGLRRRRRAHRKLPMGHDPFERNEQKQQKSGNTHGHLLRVLQATNS